MTAGKVLVSGASIAGPALALWLARHGFEVTVVERAAAIRPGGQAVDFKGATHRTVLQRMGIHDEVLRARAPIQPDGRIVDARGRQIGTMPAAFSAGEIEIARGDLARILFEHTNASCEYVFGDSVAALHETGRGIVVDFEAGASRSFDLVVGADGIHSNVRRLAFGAATGFVEYLGRHYALATIDAALARDAVMYNEPGRMVATGGPGAPVLFVFATDPLTYDRDDVARQKRLLADAYRGAAWKVPEILAALPAATGFYMDSISRVTTARYSVGRVALVGDAAWGNALGGFGTGLAIVGAYVLAGELHRARGDHRLAYARYEARFRDYARVAKRIDAGKLLAPSTRFGIHARNRLFSVAPLFAGLMAILDRFATDIDLDDDPGTA